MSATAKDRSMIDKFSFYAVGLLCLLYAVYYSSFAELNVQLPFLDFPFFVGEIVLILILPFFFLSLIRQKVSILSAPAVYWILYFAGVVAVALYDYFVWGPLALRNAALFYYPLFAIITYHYFRKINFSRAEVYVMLALVMIALVFKFIQQYYWLTFILLAMILLPAVSWRWRAALAAVLIVFGHLEQMFLGSRSDLVGTYLALSFLTAAVLIMLDRRNIFWKIGVAAAVLTVFVAGSLHITDRNALGSMVALHDLKTFYRLEKERIRHRQYKPRELDSQLYNKNVRPPQASAKPMEVTRLAATEARRDAENSDRSGGSETPQVPSQQEIADQTESSHREPRSFNLALYNILFRIFIWEDMLQEIISRRAIWGVGFGKPQRSPTIEMLNWGSSEWSRDGWITPHNSFFHMIYRAGLMGVVMVGVMVWQLLSLSRQFVRARSFRGAFLVAILLYWIGLANFLVVLELPYLAIPFWSLFGLTAAYGWKLNHDKTT